jgi:hypothetical protein
VCRRLQAAVQRVHPALSHASLLPTTLRNKLKQVQQVLEKTLKEAEEACDQGGTKDECAVAMDAVEEVRSWTMMPAARCSPARPPHANPLPPPTPKPTGLRRPRAQEGGQV